MDTGPWTNADPAWNFAAAPQQNLGRAVHTVRTIHPLSLGVNQLNSRHGIHRPRVNVELEGPYDHPATSYESKQIERSNIPSHRPTSNSQTPELNDPFFYTPDTQQLSIQRSQKPTTYDPAIFTIPRPAKLDIEFGPDREKCRRPRREKR